MCKPLLDYQHDEPAEKAGDENLLGYVLEEEIDPVPGVDIVEPFEEDPKGHLYDAYNDRELHLVAVEPEDSLVRAVPHGVHPKRLLTVRATHHIYCNRGGGAREREGGNALATREETDAQSSEVVIHPAHEHCPEAHLQYHLFDVPQLQTRV